MAIFMIMNYTRFIIKGKNYIFKQKKKKVKHFENIKLINFFINQITANKIKTIILINIIHFIIISIIIIEYFI